MAACCDDERAAALVWEACRADPLFFLNAFVWIYEPRTEPPEVRPFLTYPFQDAAVLDTMVWFGKCDIGCEKSRDQGASWLWLAFILWRWCFWPMGDYMLVSRKQDLVDSVDDRDALMVKMEFMVSRLPAFLRPDYTRRFLGMTNEDLGGVITGTATTEDLGVGGRKTAVLIDEFALFSLVAGREVLSGTQFNTNCRIFISTPRGDSGAYYDVMHRTDGLIRKHRFHWSAHPIQRRGLYRLVEGRVQFYCTACYERFCEPPAWLCPECAAFGRVADPYEFPPDYEFGSRYREFALRSPYFDTQAFKAPSKQYLSRELEIDYGGSVSRVFDGDAINHLIGLYAVEPDRVLALREYLDARDFVISERDDVRRAFWERAGGAEIRVWGALDEELRFPSDRPYTFGADISAGTGASNSTFSAMDVKARRKVLEFVHNRIGPTELADIAVEILRGMLWGAYAMWEHQGQGMNFGQRLLERGYTNVYNRRNEQSLSKKETDTPGWTPTTQNKLEAIELYRDGLQSQEFVNPSEAALMECRQFIYDEQGRIVHKKSIEGDDPSGRKAFHGDIVIADALAWYPIAKRIVRVEPVSVPKVVKVGSRQWRDQEFQRRLAGRHGHWSAVRVRAG